MAGRGAPRVGGLYGVNMLTKVNDKESRQCSGRPGAPADQLSRCVEPIARPILVAPFPDGNPLVTASVAAHLTHPIIVRRFWSDRESFTSQVSTSRVATQLGVFRLRHRPHFSSWIPVLTQRLRQGHKPATDCVPSHRRYRCIYSYSESITPRRSAFVSCC